MNKVEQIKKELNLAYDYSKFDFNKSITRKHIDWDIYNNKFKFVDKVRKMQNPNPLYLKIINSDKTMRAYYFLRIDNKPLKLYAYQDLIMNDTYQFKYFEASNQIGKSIELDVDSVLDFVNDHGKEFNIAIVSKTLPQSSHQMRRIKQFLNNMNVMDWKEDKGSSDNMSIIELAWKDKDRKDKDGNPKVKYLNRIICVPATEAALGYDLHKENLDEFEFWEDDAYMYDQVLEPRTYGTKGDITVTTNPNGMETKGAELVNLFLPDGTRKYHVYNFMFLDRPGNTELELENAKVGKDRRTVESTLLAKRSVGKGAFLDPTDVENSYCPKEGVNRMVGKHPLGFLDVGSVTDQSCWIMGYIEILKGYDPNKEYELNKPFIEFHIPIIHLYPQGYPISRVVGSFDESHSTDGWHNEKSVDEYLKEWSVGGTHPTFGYDITGNQGMKPLFASIGRTDGIDITFSGPNKSGMYQSYRYKMEMKLIKRVKHTEWEDQAKKLVEKKSARGYILINSGSSGSSAASKNKKIEDDTQDATVGFIKLADNYDVIIPGMSVLEEDEKKEKGGEDDEWDDEDDIREAQEINDWNREMGLI